MTRTFYGAANHGEAEMKLFDGYTVLAEPLPRREDRVFRHGERGGTDYGSHSLKLATNEPGRKRPALFILVEHGGGREVWFIPAVYDDGSFVDAVLAMPPTVQYAMLYSMYRLASESAQHAKDDTAIEYKLAFLEGRIRKSRVKQGRRRVYIEPRAGEPIRIGA